MLLCLMGNVFVIVRFHFQHITRPILLQKYSSYYKDSLPKEAALVLVVFSISLSPCWWCSGWFQSLGSRNMLLFLNISLSYGLLSYLSIKKFWRHEYSFYVIISQLFNISMACMVLYQLYQAVVLCTFCSSDPANPCLP